MYKLAACIPLLLLLYPVALVMPISAHKEHGNRKFLQKSNDVKRYAVIFDAGSSGTRVHVFSFNENLDLVPIQESSEKLELFVQTKPGLSAYANDPQAAANSMVPLLEAAERVIPEELRPNTPVRVGATAGLRLLGGDKADKILEAVRDLLKNRGTLKYEEGSVSVLTGSEEGYDMWITLNFLQGNLGKEYGKTAGVVDLGGASVQMAYAISQTAAANAPSLPSGEDPYINRLTVKGTPYNVYVHSYLHYGKYAGRVEILKASDGATNPCILAGYDGIYHYGGEDYKVSASPEGPSLLACRRAAFKALKTKEPCHFDDCSFGGAWSGGGGAGENLLFISSAFHGTASKAGIIDLNLYSAKVIPKDFLVAAKHACGTKFEDAASTFPFVEKDDLPFVCMDLVYQYTLLVNGFDLLPRQEITVANSTIYHNSVIQLAWPLGTAVEALSSSVGLSSL